MNKACHTANAARRQMMVRLPLQYADGSEELYDHTNDPYEWTNIATRPESLAIIETLKKHLPDRNAAPPTKKAKKASGK